MRALRRENPGGILALAYNRHAAAEIRKRLYALIGDDANGVTVMTCHALAMRLVGASFQGKDATTQNFDEILRQATDLLRGEGLEREEGREKIDGNVEALSLPIPLGAAARTSAELMGRF